MPRRRVPDYAWLEMPSSDKGASAQFLAVRLASKDDLQNRDHIQKRIDSWFPQPAMARILKLDTTFCLDEPKDVASRNQRRLCKVRRRNTKIASFSINGDLFCMDWAFEQMITAFSISAAVPDSKIGSSDRILIPISGAET